MATEHLSESTPKPVLQPESVGQLALSGPNNVNYTQLVTWAKPARPLPAEGASLDKLDKLIFDSRFDSLR